MKSMLGIGLVCALVWSMHAQAASFNCDKAKTTPEQRFVSIAKLMTPM